MTYVLNTKMPLIKRKFNQNITPKEQKHSKKSKNKNERNGI